jgi:hypothetical protein
VPVATEATLSRPSRAALATAWAWLCTSSLAKILRSWSSTVRRLTPRTIEISRVVRPAPNLWK